MNLVFISHKECWPSADSPSGYSSMGGFPFQMAAISEQFDHTKLLITQPGGNAPSGISPIVGHGLSVETMPTPAGGRWHKLNLIPWTLKYFTYIWNEIAKSDAVHAAVPGDVGSIGMVVALLQNKRLFIRHCGTFGEPVTASDRILLWLLENIASDRIIVLATGGSDALPSKKNPNISWIFSTTLTQSEIELASPAAAWNVGQPLRLITVCRLEDGKNVQAIIQSLLLLRERIPHFHLDVLGDGDYRPVLENLTARLNITGHVTFHGNVDHASVMKQLSQAHIFIFPTNVKEGFPKAVLEALACGLPVVATRISVIPQLLKNGSGLLLDDTSAPFVADAILKVIAEPERFDGMRRLAREAAQGYTLDAWGRIIGEKLRASWGPLRSGGA